MGPEQTNTDIPKVNVTAVEEKGGGDIVCVQSSWETCREEVKVAWTRGWPQT